MVATSGDARDPVMTAAFDLIGRTGADTCQIRCSSENKPVVWVAVATFDADKAEAAAAVTPQRAILRLAEQLVDGGQCLTCHRPSGVADHLGEMPLDELVCWYQYDPERETFRRGCQGIAGDECPTCHDTYVDLPAHLASGAKGCGTAQGDADGPAKS